MMLMGEAIICMTHKEVTPHPNALTCTLFQHDGPCTPRTTVSSGCARRRHAAASIRLAVPRGMAQRIVACHRPPAVAGRQIGSVGVGRGLEGDARRGLPNHM